MLKRPKKKVTSNSTSLRSQDLPSAIRMVSDGISASNDNKIIVDKSSESKGLLSVKKL